MLADVIGDSDGSRFYWALVDNAIAEDADFGFYPHDGCGVFYIALTTVPERTDEALDIALKELEKAKTDLKDDEVERAKNKIASSLVLQRRGAAGPDAQHRRAVDLQQAVPLAGNGHGHARRRSTATRCEQLMRDFPFDPMTIVTLGPGEKGQEK